MTRLSHLPSRIGGMRARLAPAPKVAASVYRSKEWKQLLAQVIAARGRLCQKCGSRSGRIYGDHVIELRDGGAALDKRNVMLLCATCHGAKTERSKRERAGLG